MQAAQNELITRISPGTPCGQLLRRYWQPVALLDEFNPALDPRKAQRPLKAVRVLGQDLVLFRDEQGRYGLLDRDRDCPHRGADLSFARHDGDGIRCPFHGWKFAADGRCLDTPAEPAVPGEPSTLCQHVRQRSYPLREAAGVLFAYLGPEGGALPELPAFDCFAAPTSHSFAFKGLWHCNWLQAFEVGIDPAHPSFLHRYLEDETPDPDKACGRQFRAASGGEIDGQRWPMTRVIREVCSPQMVHEEVAPGLTRLTALRPISEATTHVRVTHAAFPQTFVIPLSETVTITQMHQWAVESMGPIQDRTREHLGQSDKVIMANRRMLLKAMATVQVGGTPPWCWMRRRLALCKGPTPGTAWPPARTGSCIGSKPRRPNAPPHLGWQARRSPSRSALHDGCRLVAGRHRSAAAGVGRPARHLSWQDRSRWCRVLCRGTARRRGHGQHAAPERHLGPHRVQGVR